MTGLITAIIAVAVLIALLIWAMMRVAARADREVERGIAAYRAKTALEAAERAAATKKRIDDAQDVGADPDAARRWLREREAARERARDL